jgi:hypothetical protein
MSTAWVVPTARAVPWSPLVGVAGCLAVVGVVAAYAETWPASLLGLAAAGVAAALVAGLSDPAAALLSAAPTSATRRRLQRQMLLVPVGLAVWLAYVAAGRTRVPELGWALGPVTALVLTGFAVAAWAPRFGVRAGVAAPLLWYAVTFAVPSDRAPYSLLIAWQQHPWAVAAVATVALIAGKDLR